MAKQKTKVAPVETPEVPDPSGAASPEQPSAASPAADGTTPAEGGSLPPSDPGQPPDESAAKVNPSKNSKPPKQEPAPVVRRKLALAREIALGYGTRKAGAVIGTAEMRDERTPDTQTLIPDPDGNWTHGELRNLALNPHLIKVVTD